MHPRGRRLSIHDARGRELRVLLEGTQPTGDTQISFDGSDADGRPLASGVYFSVLTTEEGTVTRKLSLVR